MPNSGPSSRSAPSGARENLDDLIRQRIRKTWDDKDFVPSGAIAQLTTREKVEDHLKRNKSCFPKDVSTKSLVEYVLDKRMPAKKVFLALVYCDKLKYLQSLQNNGFCDKHLPVRKSRGKNGKISIFSLRVDSKNMQPWNLFEKWPAFDAESFADKHWLFFAPVFFADRFQYDVDRQCPLPFLKKLSTSKDGYGGTVFEVDLPKSHKPVLYLVRHFSLIL